jgi:2-polyprenyl-3-methyl-5-hydroxy-6-metoxy-1,4-benzoquinol methylase
MKLNGEFLANAADSFTTKLGHIKSENAINWYPYGILHNFHNLKNIFNAHPLDSLAVGHVYDVGAADGDLAFFLEDLGYQVTCIEKKSSNFNDGSGLELLKQSLDSPVNIEYLDIDASEWTIMQNRQEVSLTFFLGIFYHLQNPLQALKNLSKISQYLIFSTRIADTANGIDISTMKVAYLLAPDELNNDDTNWWIFTKPALLQAFERTGWDVICTDYIGDLRNSNPVDKNHDQRIYALLKSKHF